MVFDGFISVAAMLGESAVLMPLMWRCRSRFTVPFIVAPLVIDSTFEACRNVGNCCAQEVYSLRFTVDGGGFIVIEANSFNRKL